MYKNREKLFWIVMSIAFMAGILFVNLSMNTYQKTDPQMLQKIVANIESTGENKKNYFYFLAKRRTGAYLFLGLLGDSLAGWIWLFLYGIWFCFAEGICFTTAYLQNNVSGIWCMLLLQIPQSVCYGLIYVHLMKSKMMQKNEKKYRFFLEWLYLLPVLFAGVSAECYIAPWLISGIKKWLL